VYTPVRKNIGLVIALLLIAGVIAAKALKQNGPRAPVPPTPAAQEAVAPGAESANAEAVPENVADTGDTAEAAIAKRVPALLELGSVGCKPCEHMAPIIEELKKELAGKVFVEFYDVARDPSVADKYGVMAIPTQIFLDPQGKELFRHTGVFEKEEILKKMRELGMLKG
jgi:thioredoxin 1